MDSIKRQPSSRVSQIEFWVVFLIPLILFLFALWQIQTSSASGIEIKTNPLFDKINTTTGEKLATDDKTPKVYTQQQNDMTMLYGKLENISQQIKELQDRPICGK